MRIFFGWLQVESRKCVVEDDREYDQGGSCQLDRGSPLEQAGAR